MSKILRALGAIGLLSISLSSAQAGIVAEYDASAATNQRPDQVAPAWTAIGNDATNANSTDAGNFLQTIRTGPGSGVYQSPASQTVSMLRNTNDYSIETRVQPIGDLDLTSTVDTRNLHIRWADNTNWYLLAFDLDTDDIGVGSTGGVVYGTTSPVTAVSGIDWSTPHTVAVVYQSATDDFDIHIDGLLATTIAQGTLALGANTGQPINKVQFGDGTSAGAGNYSTNWYFVRLYDEAIVPVPEPASAMLLSIGTIAVLFCRKLKS